MQTCKPSVMNAAAATPPQEAIMHQNGKSGREGGGSHSRFSAVPPPRFSFGRDSQMTKLGGVGERFDAPAQ